MKGAAKNRRVGKPKKVNVIERFNKIRGKTEKSCFLTKWMMKRAFFQLSIFTVKNVTGL